MMKLQYLHDRREMVHGILKRWSHDEDRLDWLDRYRISANAVYPFSSGGKLHFLRFAPVTEKRENQLRAELAWLKRLDEQGMPVSRNIPSRNGKLVERVETDWGFCDACVFMGVEGQRMDWMDWNPLPEAAIRATGRALAELHQQGMRGRSPKDQRPWSWEDALNWCEQVVNKVPLLPLGALGLDESGNPRQPFFTDPHQVSHAADRLRKCFSTLPKNEETYGPVHYDFEMDNLFWQPEADRCVPIDFDDCMIHWYGMDLCKTLESIQETMEEKQEEAGMPPESPETHLLSENAKVLFLEGYRTILPIHEFQLTFQEAFARFAALIGYARVVYSVQKVEEEEPDWMTELRGHLYTFLIRRRAQFAL